jgi:tRNA threonylcarbamoyladenosine biosynthesis protein TsaE
MIKTIQRISKNTKDTEKIAQNFLKHLMLKRHFDITCKATVVCLSGELGAGKSTFTQFIAKNLGIKKKVDSPTFVIIKRYIIRPFGRPTSEFKNLFHIDAYRLKNEKELLHLEWIDIISNSQNIVFIEWPENVSKIIPQQHHKINISHTKEGYRKFNIKYI